MNLSSHEELNHLGEAYKFTPLKHFFETLDETRPSAIPPFIQTDFLTLLFTDGRLQNNLNLPEIKVSKLNKSELKTGPLSALAHELMTDHILIEVQKNKTVTLRVLHQNKESDVSAPMIMLKVGAFSQVTLLEEVITQTNKGHAHLAETYVTVEDGAQVDHIQIEQGHEASLHHGSTYASVARDASYKNLVFHVAGKLNRRNLELNLNASGANGESYNLFLTGGTEHSDINTVMNHHVADTTSNQIAKGILDGNSKGVFTGKIFIHPQAQRVASGQLNKNLLLSQKAQVHSQPQLEIFADDVKCSHGSTTGQLSDNELFYFEARGIPEERARTLLAHGFGLEIVQKIKDKDVQKLVADLVLETLKTKFKLGTSTQEVK